MPLELPAQTDVDDVHAHPRHVGHRWIDLILALAAIFISGVSLHVAMEHDRIEQQLVQENARLVQASSWPFLQIEGEYSDTRPDTVTLVDAGIGPAKLETFQVFYRGKPEPDVRALLEDCCGLPTDPVARKASAPNGLMIADATGTVLRPGQARPIMVIDATPQQHVLAHAFLAASRSIRYRACYCSVFDVCWIGDLSGLKPRPTANCPVEGTNFNQGTG